MSSQLSPYPDSEPFAEREPDAARWLLAPRLGYGLMIGAALLFLAAAYAPLVWLDIVWCVGLLAAAWSDRRVLRACEHLSARRAVSPILSMGASNRVELVVRNRSEVGFRCLLRDEPPLDFDTGALRIECKLPGGGETLTGYSVTPRKRGDYEFGRLEVRLTSGFGLLARQLRFDMGQRVKVYPNLASIRSYEMHARKRHLPDIGVHPVRLMSLGMEFESLRAYLPGDEPRRIDWKATARHAELITRQYEVERSQHVIICLDLGRTMLSQLGALTKTDHAVNAAALLAHVAGRYGDWVGLYAFSSGAKLYVPPRKSQFRRVMEALYGLEAERVESDYHRSFVEAVARMRKRALLVLLTDLVDPDASARLLANIRLLVRRHLVLCAALSDYELYELAAQPPDEPRELYERTVATALLADRRRALAGLWDRGVIGFDATPENLSVEVLNRYLEVKARARL